MNALPRRLRARAQPPTLTDDPVVTRHPAFIRALPCLACGKPPPSECAQIGMPARIGSPTGEHYLVPLCGPASVWDDCCHSQKHDLSAGQFWSALGIDPVALATRLWRVSGDVEAGEREIRHARQAIAAATRQVTSARMGSINRVARSGRQSSFGKQRAADSQSTASSGLVLTSGVGP